MVPLWEYPQLPLLQQLHPLPSHTPLQQIQGNKFVFRVKIDGEHQEGHSKTSFTHLCDHTISDNDDTDHEDERIRVHEILMTLSPKKFMFPGKKNTEASTLYNFVMFEKVAVSEKHHLDYLCGWVLQFLKTLRKITSKFPYIGNNIDKLSKVINRAYYIKDNCKLPFELITLIKTKTNTEVIQLIKLNQIIDKFRDFYDDVNHFIDMMTSDDVSEKTAKISTTTVSIDMLTDELAYVKDFMMLKQIIENLPKLFELPELSEMINIYNKELHDILRELPDNIPEFRTLWKIAGKLGDFWKLSEEMLEFSMHRDLGKLWELSECSCDMFEECYYELIKLGKVENNLDQLMELERLIRKLPMLYNKIVEVSMFKKF